MRDLFEKPPSAGKVTWPPAEPAKRPMVRIEILPYQPPSFQAQVGWLEMIECARHHIFEQMVIPRDLLGALAPRPCVLGTATFAGATVTLGPAPAPKSVTEIILESIGRLGKPLALPTSEELRRGLTVRRDGNRVSPYEWLK